VLLIRLVLRTRAFLSNARQFNVLFHVQIQPRMPVAISLYIPGAGKATGRALLNSDLASQECPCRQLHHVFPPPPAVFAVTLLEGTGSRPVWLFFLHGEKISIYQEEKCSGSSSSSFYCSRIDVCPSRLFFFSSNKEEEKKSDSAQMSPCPPNCWQMN
jgi:hypothetical protein